ncbi:MAG TPA: PhoU domain-containing protein, partial [Terriglobales bacterium]
MSSKSTPMPEYSAPKLLEMTQRGCEVARAAAELTARELADGRQQYLDQTRAMEDELDNLDREINLGVTAIINKVSDKQTRELLACLKFIIELERIGDLLLSVSNRAIAVAGKLAPQDAQELSSMAGIVAAMLRQIEDSFAKREVKNALHVLKADSELDRVRNLIFVRHIENHHDEQISESFHVVFIAQALERCGDHAKNMAEEICHLVSGCSVRHVIRQYEKPDEEV